MPKSKKKKSVLKSENLKNLNYTEVIRQIIRLKRTLPIPESIIDIQGSLANYKAIGDYYRNRQIEEDDIPRGRTAEVCHFLKDDNRYNVAGENNNIEISESYKRMMLNALLENNIEVLTTILAINPRYAESSLYHDNAIIPICYAITRFNLPITVMLLQHGASLLDEIDNQTPILKMLLIFASNKGNESYAKANEFLCAISKEGYLKSEDFSENQELYKDVENRILAYLKENSNTKSVN